MELLANAYPTHDYAEAVALATLSIPFADPSHRCVTVFSSSFLDKHGCTAAEAFRRNLKGQTTWLFARSPEQELLSEAFKSTWKTSGGATLNVGEKDGVVDKISQLDAMRIMAMVLRNRKELSEDWKRGTPHIAIEREGGGLTIITPHTPPEVLERFGLTK